MIFFREKSNYEDRGIKMNNTNEKDLIITFLCETIRYVNSINRYDEYLFLQPIYGKRVLSANNRIKKKIMQMTDYLNIEFIDFKGNTFSAELPVEALNLDDFSENSNLIIIETIEPTIKEKGNSHILRYGKVLVGENK